MIHLSTRLQALADLVPEGARFIDVGTDHARLPAYLVQAGVVPSALACDIGRGPLERAERTLRATGLEARVRLLLSDGLSRVAPDRDAVIAVAGMGGETIRDILVPAPWTREGPLLLLQPTTGADTLRRFLETGGYEVTGERLTRDAGRLYVTISARGGEMRYTHPARYFTGTHLGEDPLWGALLEKLERRFAGAVEGLLRSSTPGLEARRREYEEILEEVRRFIHDGERSL